MAWAVPLLPPPDEISAPDLWTALLVLGVTKAQALASIAQLVTDSSWAQLDADLLSTRVAEASRFERIHPAMLLLAQRLGVASTQSEVDDLFRWAATS